MKSIGIIRKVDELGRIVIPKELRDKFGIIKDDPIEIFVEGDTIILKQYKPSCIFCGNVKNVTVYRDKLLCEKCISAISKL